jgi:hypothetical protein
MRQKKKGTREMTWIDKENYRDKGSQSRLAEITSYKRSGKGKLGA